MESSRTRLDNALRRDIDNFINIIRSIIDSENFENDLILFSDLVPLDNIFFEKGLKPNKVTLLHRAIFFCIDEYDKYDMRKGFQCMLGKCHRSEGFDYVRANLGCGSENMDNEYLGVMMDVTSSVFNRIFTDRQLMYRFNGHIAKKVSTLKKS